MRQGRLLVVTTPTTKVTCSPGRYRCRAERRVSTQSPRRRPAARAWGKVCRCSAPWGDSGWPRRGREPRSQLSLVGKGTAGARRSASERALDRPRGRRRAAILPGAWLPPSASFTAQWAGRAPRCRARTTTRRASRWQERPVSGPATHCMIGYSMRDRGAVSGPACRPEPISTGSSATGCGATPASATACTPPPSAGLRPRRNAAGSTSCSTTPASSRSSGDLPPGVAAAVLPPDEAATDRRLDRRLPARQDQRMRWALC